MTDTNDAIVVVIGSGGREHALCYGLDASEKVAKVYAIPGNAGTTTLAKGENVALAVNDYPDILEFCKTNNVNFVVIGPDQQVADGLGDQLRAAGFVTFGVSQAAAQLEASKAYATEFMQANGIPLPPSIIVGDAPAAGEAVDQFGGPENAVIKASGLAGGKGVFLPDSEAEASQAIDDIIAGKVDGDGTQFVIQQRYHGPEVSVFALSDGQTVKIIPLASQDHKRLLAGDKGPNTGGMGVYAPLPDWMLNQEQWSAITDIANKTIAGMAAAGTPYQGVLYLGIMLAEELQNQAIVIEYNARFGDPETEIIIPLLLANNVDIYDMLYATANGSLADFPLPETLQGAAITVCLAAQGYPAAPIPNAEIQGLNLIYKDVIVFHGGTKLVDNKVQASGGRVLYVTGLGDTLEVASDAANAAIGDSGVHFANMQYRTDIGHRAFNK